MNLEKVAEISELINSNGVRWALGASLVLYFNGIVDNPHDMDIMVSEADEALLHRLLSSMGTYKPKPYTEPYKTKGFYHYTIKDLEIDVMAGFAIAHEKGIYDYTFDEEAIECYYDLKGVKVPLTALEDWYILYQLIPGREKKVKLIEDILVDKGINNLLLLKRALKKELPRSIRSNVEKLIRQDKLNRL